MGTSNGPALDINLHQGCCQHPGYKEGELGYSKRDEIGSQSPSSVFGLERPVFSWLYIPINTYHYPINLQCYCSSKDEHRPVQRHLLRVDFTRLDRPTKVAAWVVGYKTKGNSGFCMISAVGHEQRLFQHQEQ